MELSSQSWVVALLAAWLVGASKAGLSGAVTIAVVLFASIIPAREATGALLPVLICADFIAVSMLRNQVRWLELMRIFPWTAVGIGLGTVMLYFSNDAQVQRVIGAIVAGMTLYQLYRKAHNLSDMKISQHPAFAPSMGVAAGFTTMVANAAGPFVLIYMLAMRMGKLEVVGSIAWYFLVVNLFKVPFCPGAGSHHLGFACLQPMANPRGGAGGRGRPPAAKPPTAKHLRVDGALSGPTGGLAAAPGLGGLSAFAFIFGFFWAFLLAAGRGLAQTRRSQNKPQSEARPSPSAIANVATATRSQEGCRRSPEGRVTGPLEVAKISA